MLKCTCADVFLAPSLVKEWKGGGVERRRRGEDGLMGRGWINGEKEEGGEVGGMGRGEFLVWTFVLCSHTS